MLEWIVSSSVLILIIMAIRYLLKGKISLRVQYALWALVLVRLLVPVSFGSSTFSVSNFLPESIRQEERMESHGREIVGSKQQSLVITENMGENGQELLLPVHEVNNDTTVSLKPEQLQEMQLSINWWNLVNIVWVIGSIFVCTVLITANVLFAMRLKKSRKKMEQSVGRLNVYCTKAVETPCLFGIFSPVVYLTPSVMEHEMSMKYVLEHEYTHYCHGDHIWSILRGICLVFHWYNPLVWWAASLSGADAELACDEATIKRIGEQERTEYGRTLLDMTCKKQSHRLVTATMMTGSKRRIKERITLLVKKPQMAVATLAVVIVLAVAAVGCTFTGDKKETNADNLEQPMDNPTPVAMLTPEPISKTEQSFDIQAELDAIETAYVELQEKLQADISLNSVDMNTLAGECSTLWEEAMDTFWYMLEPMLTADEVMKLHTEQQEWLSKRDAEIQKIIEEYEGGSITGLLVGQRKAELTRERVYELTDYLTKVVEQVINVPVKDYSGRYVDTQGTDVVYSELILTRQEDSSYQAEIGIYRLALFEGTAVQQGSLLMFEDPDMRVKGNIRISDGEAIFTVTESFFEYVTPGEGFEFTKSE